jgi:hypothetical protein
LFLKVASNQIETWLKDPRSDLSRGLERFEGEVRSSHGSRFAGINRQKFQLWPERAYYMDHPYCSLNQSSSVLACEASDEEVYRVRFPFRSGVSHTQLVDAANFKLSIRRERSWKELNSVKVEESGGGKLHDLRVTNQFKLQGPLEDK